MPIVELPDGREVEFPEGTGPDLITSSLRRDFGGFFPKAEPFSDIVNPSANVLPESTTAGGPRLALPEAKVALAGLGSELGQAAGSLAQVPAQAADIARAIPADVAAAASLFQRPQNVPTTAFPSPTNIRRAIAENAPYVAEAAGNVPAALANEPLPVDTQLAEAAKESIPAATLGRFAQDVAATAPLAVIGALPASAARLAALGFTADMVARAPELFNQYAEEINKPAAEQDPDTISRLQSRILQTFTFAPAGAAFGAGQPLNEVLTAFDNANRRLPAKIPPTTETVAIKAAATGSPETARALLQPTTEKGAPNAQSTGTSPEGIRPEEAQRLEPGTEGRVRVRDNAGAGLETGTGTAPQETPEIISGEQGTAAGPPTVATEQPKVGEQTPLPPAVAQKLFLRPKGGKTLYPVDSLQSAQAKYDAMRKASNLGASKLPTAEIVNANGKFIASISYNGRLWDATGKEIIPEPLNRTVEPSTPPPTPQPESAAAASLSPGEAKPNVTQPVTETQISRGPGAAAAGEPGTYSAIAQLADKLATTAKENAPIDQKIGVIERAKAATETLKDRVKSGLANVLAIKQAMWDSYVGLPKYTGMKKIVGEWFHANQKADFEAREFGKQIIKAVPDKLRREAITNWIQADGDVAVLKERAGLSRGSLRQGYEIAQNLTPRELDIATMLRDYYDQQLERGISEGLLKDGLENYITQIWKRENPITRRLQNDLVNSRLQPNFRYARKRIFDTFFEGEQAGFTPMKDAGALVAHYDQVFNKALSARAFIKALHEGTASDGRPLVEVSGSGKVVGEDEPKPKFIIRPKSAPEEISDYRTIDHPALRGWKWVGRTPEGTDVLMQGELKVHPEIYAKLRNRLSTSWFRQNPAARAVLNVQSTLKQTMLSVSMFHQVQEGLHGLGHRINPANLEVLDFSEPVTKSLVEHGLQLADHNALEQFGEGLSSGNLLNKVPGLGPKLKQYNDWLFQEHIPRLKLTMAKHALERNLERYADKLNSGEITQDQVLELTASQANHAFGELPYKYWGRNPNLQDFYRTFLLAPDFLEARGGFVGQALKPGGLGPKGLLKNEQLQALALLALTQYLTARIANQIIDRDPHWELKNAFRLISGGHAYSLRTIPGDVIHLLADPRGFTYNRLSPVVGRGSIELATGRDYRGVKRDFLEQMQDLLKSGVPISLQRKHGSTILESFGNAIGVQNQRYDAVQNIQQKIADWKSAQGIKEPYETVYSPEDDQYAALRFAIQSGRQSVAQAEFDKLKQTVKPEKIHEHFKLSWSRPLTGSKANDTKFYKTLNEVGKMEWKEAEDLRKARIKAAQSLH